MGVAVAGSQPAFATRLECRLKENAGAIAVTNPLTKEPIATLLSGDLIYSSNKFDPAGQGSGPLLILKGGKLLEIAEDLYDRINCEPPPHSVFPIVVQGNNIDQLRLLYREFGHANLYMLMSTGSLVQGPRKVAQTKHVFCSYTYRRDGFTSDHEPDYSDRVVDAQVFEKYKKMGFSLIQLCMVLEGSGVLFDPETGRRMPTYVMVNDGEMEPETLLEPPPCFAKGRTVFNKKNILLTMFPSGCRFNYHPHSGRRLSEEEANVLSRETVFLYSPIKGASEEDSKGLSKDETRRISLAKIAAIKKAN